MPNISTHTLTWSVTCQICAKKLSGDISTHTLTWSVTFFRIALQSSASISTHTLTWSVTCLHNKIGHGKRNFNSHAHVERDNQEKVVDWENANFNSHAHVERDAGIFCNPCSIAISTHTLTWSVTSSVAAFLTPNTFQLTRSRGA